MVVVEILGPTTVEYGLIDYHAVDNFLPVIQETNQLHYQTRKGIFLTSRNRLHCLAKGLLMLLRVSIDLSQLGN